MTEEAEECVWLAVDVPPEIAEVFRARARDQSRTGRAHLRHLIYEYVSEPAESWVDTPSRVNGAQVSLRHKQAVPGHPGVYYAVSRATGEVTGYGVRLPRPGAPGLSNDARKRFDTPQEATEWRRSWFNAQARAYERLAERGQGV